MKPEVAINFLNGFAVLFCTSLGIDLFYRKERARGIFSCLLSSAWSLVCFWFAMRTLGIILLSCVLPPYLFTFIFLLFLSAALWFGFLFCNFTEYLILVGCLLVASLFIDVLFFSQFIYHQFK